jgi:Clp amino terminal domain, pathogenicity island component
MLERFTGDARGVLTGAREGALRLGHDWIGCEHLLLALAATGGGVGTVLRDQGITPERVRLEAVRLAGAGRGASLSDVLDRDALASIGIDLDAVRGKVEAAFGPGALPRRRPGGHTGGTGCAAGCAGPAGPGGRQRRGRGPATARGASRSPPGPGSA